MASLEPTYEPEGPANSIPPPIAPDASPSIQDLLLRKFARLEEAPPALATTDISGSTALTSPPMAPNEPTVIYCGSSSVPIDLSWTFIISP